MKKYVSKTLGIANRLGAWLVIIVIMLILSFCTNRFLTFDNIINVLRQACVVSIVALGASFVILGGEIDLSSGMAATFAGCNAAIMVMKMGFPIAPSIILAVLIGAVMGTLMGYIVTYWKVTSFIATLGVNYIILGLILITTDSIPISGLPENFLMLGRGYLFGIIPVPVIIMLAFFAVGSVVLKYTPFGRSVIAVGENVEAAKLSGLNVNLTRVLIFTIGGFCAAFAGIVQAARLSSGQPTSGGAELGLQGIAAVYIGGTFQGSMLNTLAGSLAWAFVSNGMNLLGVNAYWQNVVLGIVIIAAVLFNSVRQKAFTAAK
ncbi:MAG: ABC transporter permease [Ruminococcaceae bacterium]|nr:ABC transporter permease [Oscillospiraceae bacterium]